MKPDYVDAHNNLGIAWRDQGQLGKAKASFRKALQIAVFPHLVRFTEKLPLPLEGIWLAALKVHVVAASFCLPACILLQWKGLLRRAPRAQP